tara:strand:+ start:5842 stop:6018 length:177 start_codon:yes stop_codon:yes gene_type:complete
MENYTQNEIKEFKRFLNDLRESGTTNMFGASQNLIYEFGIEKSEARKILSHWMKNFTK